MRLRTCGVALVLVTSLTGAPDVVAEDATPRKPRCAFQREDHPEYVLWVCNAQGTAHSEQATILRTRTNRGGAEVVSAVWRGPLARLVSDVEDIIGTHAREHARCASYFHLARAGEQGPAWNLANRSMQEAWAREGAERFASVCYTSEPSAADFIVMWTGPDGRLPSAFSLDLPSTVTRGGAEPVPTPAEAPGPEAGASPGSLAVYQVNPGFDGEVVRLGPTLMTVGPGEANAADGAGPLRLALRFLAALPR